MNDEDDASKCLGTRRGIVGERDAAKGRARFFWCCYFLAPRAAVASGGDQPQPSNGEHGRTSSRMSVASASTGERSPSQQYTNTCTQTRAQSMPRPRARDSLLAVLHVADNVNGDIQSLVLAYEKLPSHSSEPPKPPFMSLLIARMVPRKRRRLTIFKYLNGLHA